MRVGGLQVAKQVSNRFLFDYLFWTSWGGLGQPEAVWLHSNSSACIWVYMGDQKRG